MNNDHPSSPILMKPILFLFLCLLAAFSVQAQLSLERQVVATAGTTLNSGSLSQDFTLGESVISLLNGNSLQLSQGFQQARFGSLSGRSELLETDGLIVFPQPAQRTLMIRLKRPAASVLSVQLYDLWGRQLLPEEARIAPQQLTTQFDLARWPNGTYLLRITDASGRLLHQRKWTKG